MFKGSSPFSDYVDATFLTITGISLLVLIGLLITMVIFLVKYNRTHNPYSKNIEGNVSLEITWTTIPLILFMGIFYLGWRGYLEEIQVPEDALPVHVTGQMWKWTFEYPNGVQTDTLYVPVGAAMKLTLHSLDVNHSLFIPAFRIKKDVIPNRENVLWFRTPRIASYDIACAEYCGLQHSYMYTKIIARDTASFEAWLYMKSALQSKTYAPLTAQKSTQEIP